MARGEKPVDFGMAEALAFASLVVAGTPVRLSGQDSRRGTFNHRHAVLIDVENESEHLPLATLTPGQARFEIYDSVLSEAAVLGFEYGFSRDTPEALVLWEAQFGDFGNGAQIVIDQFLAAGEDKWGLLSGLVMLLPHGYEGQGPEHSSARVERYLQLAGEENMVVAQPSTAGQYFHLLRRQALRHWRKPLIVFTPKSGLRNPDACSPLADLAAPRFANVLPDAKVPAGARRILLATGKIVHELRAERDQAQGRRRRRPRPRAALPLPRSRAHRRARRLPGRPRARLGPGRARQHGRPRLRHAPPRPHRPRPRRPLRQALPLRQPRHRLAQSPRPRAEDAAEPGVRLTAAFPPVSVAAGAPARPW